MGSRTLNFVRKCSGDTRKIKFYTTPIYYVNANPHIGHLYTSLIADAAQRWQRVVDRKSLIRFSTGTDEHGSKIQHAASLNGVSPVAYCDRISSQYKRLSDEFDIQYTDFIRTTSEDHKKTLKLFWEKLTDNSNIYKSAYEGYYCVQDEIFLSNSQLKEVPSNDGGSKLVSAESGHPVEWTSEENYMFKLSKFRDDLIYWLKKDENVIRPRKFHKYLLDLMHRQDDDDGGVLQDLSVSRPSSRVHWGIPVPGDESQTVYVWLDALVNYLTAAGYGQDPCYGSCWPPHLQVIGKDIIKFHGVYWPAFLMAAGLEPPHSILCHSHWTVDGEKMSKSKGNVVCPFDRSITYTTDGMRYFLLREGVAHSDGNYSDTKVMRILNSELADTFGNLLSRCCSKSLNPEQKFPQMDRMAFESVSSLDVTKKLIENVSALPDKCREHYDDLNFYKVVDVVIATLHAANLFVETMKPWELKKNPETLNKLNVTLHLTFETLRVSAILLQPIIPKLSGKLLDKLNVANEDRYFENLGLSWNISDFEERNLSRETVILFRRILLENEQNDKRKSKS